MGFLHLTSSGREKPVSRSDDHGRHLLLVCLLAAAAAVLVLSLGRTTGRQDFDLRILFAGSDRVRLSWRCPFNVCGSSGQVEAQQNAFVPVFQVGSCAFASDEDPEIICLDNRRWNYTDIESYRSEVVDYLVSNLVEKMGYVFRVRNGNMRDSIIADVNWEDLVGEITAWTLSSDSMRKPARKMENRPNWSSKRRHNNLHHRINSIKIALIKMQRVSSFTLTSALRIVLVVFFATPLVMLFEADIISKLMSGMELVFCPGQQKKIWTLSVFFGLSFFFGWSSLAMYSITAVVALAAFVATNLLLWQLRSWGSSTLVVRKQRSFLFLSLIGFIYIVGFYSKVTLSELLAIWTLFAASMSWALDQLSKFMDFSQETAIVLRS